MSTKLTLRLDDGVIRKAKKKARHKGVSLSRMFRPQSCVMAEPIPPIFLTRPPPSPEDASRAPARGAVNPNARDYTRLRNFATGVRVMPAACRRLCRRGLPGRRHSSYRWVESARLMIGDAIHPITGCSMDCRWVYRIAASGSDGACITQCAGVDKDGDLFSFRALAFGAGKYEVGPGTGKYVSATGGGTFETGATDDPGLAYTRWRGTLQFKK